MQIKINESAPMSPDFAQSENYGPDNMARIAPKTARGLCGMYPLPRIGHEVCVAVNVSHGARLYVANIGGAFFVRSPSVSVDTWPERFSVTLKRAFVVPNLDAMNADELRDVYEANKGKRERLRRDVAAYAINKAVAMDCRASGKIQEAATYEGICERIYAALPDGAKW